MKGGHTSDIGRKEWKLKRTTKPGKVRPQRCAPTSVQGILGGARGRNDPLTGDPSEIVSIYISLCY